MASRSYLKLCLRCTLPGDSIARMGLQYLIRFASGFPCSLLYYCEITTMEVPRAEARFLISTILNSFLLPTDSWNADPQTKHGYPVHTFHGYKYEHETQIDSIATPQITPRQRQPFPWSYGRSPNLHCLALISFQIQTSLRERAGQVP